MIKRRDPFDEFGHLIRRETATSLGLAGRKLKKALDALAAWDADSDRGRPDERAGLFKAACDSLHAYLVQKELNGLADNQALKRAFRIPAEIWHALGFVDERDPE